MAAPGVAYFNYHGNEYFVATNHTETAVSSQDAPIETRKLTRKSLLRGKHAGSLPPGLRARLWGYRVEASGIPVPLRPRRLLAEGQESSGARSDTRGWGRLELKAESICAKLALSVDRTTMAIESEIKVFEDRITSGEWRVEYFDDDGGCYVAIFAGPAAEQRARDYRDALTARLLTPVSVTPNLS
jgi:hypothetical protein